MESNKITLVGTTSDKGVVSAIAKLEAEGFEVELITPKDVPRENKHRVHHIGLAAHDIGHSVHAMFMDEARHMVVGSGFGKTCSLYDIKSQPIQFEMPIKIRPYQYHYLAASQIDYEAQKIAQGLAKHRETCAKNRKKRKAKRKSKY